MLVRLISLAGVAALAALVVPNLATSFLTQADNKAPAPDAVSRPAATAKYATGRSVVLDADGRGHFFGTFRINGRTERGLVDTGASAIAINLSTARRLGISPSGLSFTARVSTANGEVEAAPTTLNRIEIGGISVRDVRALVLPDKALSGTLIGMTFLNRLSSFRVEDGALHLVR
ncbi:MAG TPA: TIGR02281 family clan AA aspartic protease [Ensifer sp.]|jgi:aspartyl protease family protein|uniref:TIGR02281 family clan AA aspartic protease n=1 Tax=Ensifer sp. TaxID=1872086 RepID=UPI002E0D9645|nr:TIGR02281 family clan AA aspartic protease [Ensifer sp.]